LWLKVWARSAGHVSRPAHAVSILTHGAPRRPDRRHRKQRSVGRRSGGMTSPSSPSSAAPSPRAAPRHRHALFPSPESAGKSGPPAALARASTHLRIGAMDRNSRRIRRVGSYPHLARTLPLGARRPITSLRRRAKLSR